MPKESVAEILYWARRDLGIVYKNITPQALREYIYSINRGRYGDPLGITWEDLIRKKTFDQIIISSARPNIDSLLGGFGEWMTWWDILN